MHTRAKLLTAALTAALLLTLGAGAATASRSFSVVRGGQAIRATSVEGISFGSEGGTVTSDVTLHGSIHALIPKTVGALVGVITLVLTANCRHSFGFECRTIGLAGRLDPLTNVVGPPWHIILLSFTGTLPNITRIVLTVARAEFLLDIENKNPACLYRGDISAGGAAVPDPSGGRRIERLVIEGPRNRARLFRILVEEFFRRCPREGTLSGAFNLVPLIIIRLH